MGWVEPIAGLNCPAGLTIAAFLRSIQRLSPRRTSRIERIPALRVLEWVIFEDGGEL